MAVGRPHTDQNDAAGRALFVGARLFLAADAFLFLAFLFAYLYLRALDSNGMWHPSGIDPSLGLGIATTVIVAATAVVAYLGRRRPGTQLGWVVVGGLAVAALLAAIQLFDPGFSPSVSGGYGSVFIGFTAVYLVHLLGGLYWAETTVASASRSPDAELGPVEAESVSAYLVFLAAVMVVAFILLYVV